MMRHLTDNLEATHSLNLIANEEHVVRLAQLLYACKVALWGNNDAEICIRKRFGSDD